MRAKRILAPVDFSDDSKNALKEADRLAGEWGARLTVMHAQPLHKAALADALYEHPQEMVVRTVVHTVEQELDAFVADLTTPSEQLVTKVRIGPAIAEIVDESADHDLLVIASHGKSDFTYFLLGSVTERVVRASRCSVFLVKRHQFESPKQD